MVVEPILETIETALDAILTAVIVRRHSRDGGSRYQRRPHGG
jgi:hypothetical protein